MMPLAEATPVGHPRDLAEVFTPKILKLIPGQRPRPIGGARQRAMDFAAHVQGELARASAQHATGPRGSTPQ
jgi:hypothetical protein